MNTLALNAQSPQPTATAESNNVAASDTTSSSDSSPVDTFLTLFVAEIQNQDPTDPTDATEYIDQLSSMAQVAMMEEMSVQANTNAVLMSNIQVMALGNLVGDDIMVQTTALQVSGQTINGRATLDDACTTADLHFTDAAGDDYTVSLIPHTREVTNLRAKRTGSRLNIETDIIGKYVEKLMTAKDTGHAEAAEGRGGITPELLARYGF